MGDVISAIPEINKMSPQTLSVYQRFALTVFFFFFLLLKKNFSLWRFLLELQLKRFLYWGESRIISGYDSVICKDSRERNIPEGSLQALKL